jgi:hypothetical protein
MDFLFNFLLISTTLLIISVLAITVKQEDANVDKKGEFVISVDWDKQYNNDVDTWVRSPDGTVVWFQNRETKHVTLDRDDLGHINDTRFVESLNEIVPNPNQEIVTLRGIQEGEWIVNIHLFREPEAGRAVPVTITMIKLNPKASLVFKREITLAQKWDQVTVARVGISAEGEVLYSDDGPFMDLIQEKVHNMYSGNTQEGGM